MEANSNFCQIGRHGMITQVIVAVCLIFSKSGFAAVADDLRFETNKFMRDTAFRNPEHIAANPAPSGAYSPVNIRWDQTHEGAWYIEEQRYGGDAVCAGVATENASAIDRGLKILRWGFEHQEPDGSFNCPDAFHSASFFVESAAHACLVLSGSQYARQYKNEIEWMQPRVLKAALWMTQPSVERAGKAHNAPYTHRRYLVAAALGEAGVFTGNQSLIEKSTSYLQEGIDLQAPSGSNPEKGGDDCSYHAAGLFYAERYYDLVADSETRERLRDMLKKGYAWLQNHVLPDGTIDVSGNTRVGAGQEQGRNGAAKKVNYGVIYQGLYHWSVISGDATYEQLAQKVFGGETIYKRSTGKS
jgi:hypothetical protein